MIPGRIELEIKDGIVLVGSDAHYFPGEASTGHKAFCKFAKLLKPSHIVMNGDAFDGASISRHPSIMWEHNPSVEDELKAVNLRLSEIVSAASKNTTFLWPLGNHDQRFETKLSTVAPEYKGISGFHLKDHVDPCWLPCWSIWINHGVVIKHRSGSGFNAVQSATVSTGKTIITGHLHSLRVSPYTDYSGTRFGVDTGTLADINGPQFKYLEDGHRNWRSGFIVLTFRQSKLMWPEIVHVIAKDQVEFRGQIYQV